MKRLLHLLAMAAVFTLAWSCDPHPFDDDDPKNPHNPTNTSEKLSGITYQLNVYSFADSDGNGWGDLKGITEHLDYLDELGATALWLSPIQTAASYHGYDILDYYSVDPRLGTEADLKDLIDKAHAKNISIYLDYVLNHSGRGEWFNSAVSGADSPYRSYYVLSEDPASDVSAGRVDNFAGAKNPGMGTWHSATSGAVGYNGLLHFKLDVTSASAPKLTVTTTTEAAQNANTDASVNWFIYENNAVRMYKTGDKTYEITLNINNDWGVLVKDSATEWGDHKWGAKAGDQKVEFGKAKTLVKGDAANDITFGGSSIMYFASFDQSMPDLNYGPYASASESAAFKDLAASADKWINMGVDGLRLDAVMWIYQCQAKANATFLKQWYDHCNATYKARGGEGDIYMVGEAFDEASKVASYYEGLPSLFGFSYWWTLTDRINGNKGSDFAKTVLAIQKMYAKYRPDFIDAIKLSNHDEDRAGSDLGRSADKMKLAGAVLLTSPGKPFIYQGEELGYWGKKENGDEYIRTPIKWTKDGKVPTSALNGKYDRSMLTADISVEAQKQDAESVLSVYKKFAFARNNNDALANGTMGEVTSSNSAVGMWTMTSSNEKVLVVHNFCGTTVTASISGFKTNDCIVSNGSITLNGGNITLGKYASAVYKQ